MLTPNLDQAKKLETLSNIAYDMFENAIQNKRLHNAELAKSSIETLGRYLVEITNPGITETTTPETEPFDRYHLQWLLQFNSLDTLIQQIQTNKVISHSKWLLDNVPEKYKPIQKTYNIINEINHPKRYTLIRLMAVELAETSAYEYLDNILVYVFRRYEPFYKSIQMSQRKESKTLQEFYNEHPGFGECIDKIIEKEKNK